MIDFQRYIIYNKGEDVIVLNFFCSEKKDSTKIL